MIARQAAFSLAAGGGHSETFHSGKVKLRRLTLHGFVIKNEMACERSRIYRDHGQPFGPRRD
jgi:hypothetical protein